MSTNAKCCFCKSEANMIHVAQMRNYYSFNCPICKLYFISHGLFEKLEPRTIDNTLLACIADNIKYNAEIDPTVTSWHSSGETIPPIASELTIRYFENYLDIPVDHSNKPSQLLELLGEKIGKGDPFTKVTLTQTDLYRLKIKDFNEGGVWASVLLDHGYIESMEVKAYRSSNNASRSSYLKICPISITPGGWAHLSSINSGVKSQQGFIAMSFGYPERSQLETALSKGCEDAGFKAVVVDKTEYTGGVVDEIMAKINQSKFVIAELTEHKNGVYFEAGYAMGRQTKVIFCVKNENAQTDGVHFDVRHLNQIRWDNYEDLREKIKNRLISLFK